MDDAGRIVIPKELRERAGLQPGAPLEARLEDGIIAIEPQPTPVRLEKRGRFVVAVPLTPGPVLKSETVERTISELRDRSTGRGRRK